MTQIFLIFFFSFFRSPVAVYLYTYTRALNIISVLQFFFYFLHFKTVARTRVPGLIARRSATSTTVVTPSRIRVAFKIRFGFGMAARDLLHSRPPSDGARATNSFSLRRWPTIRHVRDGS